MALSPGARAREALPPAVPRAGYSGQRCEVDKNECGSSPCKNSGTCRDSANSSSVAAGVYACACKGGWEGTNCAQDHYDCQDSNGTSPCKNGACKDLRQNYTCSCSKGWAGRNCTTDIDECGSKPCKNGGACADSSDSAKVSTDSFA